MMLTSWQAERREREYRKSPGQGIAPRHAPVAYFLQPGPISYLSPPPTNAITLRLHQGINPFTSLEPLRSNPFWKHPGHTQRCASLAFQIFLNPINVAIKINHHTQEVYLVVLVYSISCMTMEESPF
jgi:hypothetical protein